MALIDHEREIDTTFRTIKEHQDEITRLREDLIMRARLKSYTQDQLAALSEVAQQGIVLLTSIKEGDVFTYEWITQRDELVAKAEKLIDDTYQSS